ncbi:finger protein [Moumouvirus goulette]|uniref:Finger protein n=1 Tax=Moumouvirus goulette TaxID=1247379 RepID=M1PW56_9VIRU|nr:finger protein [Moumouvirus goulette]AGF84967.1 finger protein [Moumouvirus goulette]
MSQFKSCIICGSFEYLSRIICLRSGEYQLIHKCSVCEKIYSDKKVRTENKSELVYIPARDVLKIPIDKIRNMYRITPGPKSKYYSSGPYYTDELARFYKHNIATRKLSSGYLCYKICLGCGINRFSDAEWNNDIIDNNNNPTLCNFCMVKWYNHIGCSNNYICLRDVNIGDVLGINWFIDSLLNHKIIVFIFLVILLFCYTI